MSDEIKRVYYTVGEAAEDLGEATSAVRYWDDEYGIIKTRKEKGNKRQITVKELMTLHKIKTLTKFMNKDGIKAVLAGDIQIKVNPDLL